MSLEKQDYHRLKPGVNRKVHLFAAPFLWTVTGMMLIVRGIEWIGSGSDLFFLIPAFAVGTAKSYFILDKTARRGVDRIVNMRDGSCLGAVYSWKTWMLVGFMIISGILLRTFFVPGIFIGSMYVAIGWALIFSSRHGWIMWSKWIGNKG